MDVLGILYLRRGPLSSFFENEVDHCFILEMLSVIYYIVPVEEKRTRRTIAS